jgi:hypothetical protein
MRKRLIELSPSPASGVDPAWLPLDALCEAELTSESTDFPIEGALGLSSETSGGWRAGLSGMQTIRLRFDAPRRVSRIRLVFEETRIGRTQEFVLRWTRPGGQDTREIVRQQFTFAPPSTSREAEDYRVNLDPVAILELEITPDISRGPAFASLREFRVA